MPRLCRSRLLFQAMDNAAMMAAEVVEEIGQTSAFIVEPVYYSDPVALLNRG